MALMLSDGEWGDSYWKQIFPHPLICNILGHTSSMSLRQYTASSLEKLKVCAGTISAIPIAQEALL